MALFKVRRVKVNKRKRFVPVGKREFFYTSMDPTIQEGMVVHLPEFGPDDYYEILKDYSDGKCRQTRRRDSDAWCGRWWPK